MACPGNGRLLHAYFDGELDAAGSVEFEEHLKACPACAVDFQAQQTLRQALRGGDLYDRASETLRKRIAATPSRDAKPAAWPTRRAIAFKWLPVAAAIALSALLGARFYGERQQASLLTEEIVASHIRSLQPGHLYDVESTDQHTVKPWFDGRADFSPPVQDLTDRGFPLVGGRLDYVDHHNVAALVYKRRQHLINVFVWPAESKPANFPGERAIQGYNVISWWHNDMAFCAVSDVNPADLRQLAQLLGQ